jgi:hypothetical protein
VAGTAAAWTARIAPSVRPVARKTRALVRSGFPKLTESVAYGVLRYGPSPANQDQLLHIFAHRDHLNLGFMRGLGALVPDPSALIEGTGRVMRHVTLRTVADVERPALRAILRAAGKVRPEELQSHRRVPKRPAGARTDTNG